MNAPLQHLPTTHERLETALAALQTLRDEVHLKAMRSGSEAMQRFAEIDRELRAMLLSRWTTGSLIEACAQSLRLLGSGLHE